MNYKPLTKLNLKEEDLPLIYGKKKQTICNSEDAYKLLKKHFDKSEIKEREFFKVLLLNKSNEVIKVSDCSIGNRNECYIDVKLMFREILVNQADKILICHNHPDKNITPTYDDNVFTKAVQDVCEFFGISFLNHIIISSGGYYSYLHHGE